ncbi:MAG: efflux transporter outer membrane subunit [bacterium]
MNRTKILTLALAVSFLTSSNLAFSSEIKDKSNIKQVSSKQLKGQVQDYRIEYINAPWWESFNDPNLSAYIAKSAEANHDIKMATLRVSESQALLSESLGKEFPIIGIGSDYSFQKTSGSTKFASLSVPSVVQNSFTLPLNVRYEVDLWRKNRDKTIGMSKELEAVRCDEKAAFISLTSEVAAIYFNAVKTDKLIELQKNIIDLRKNIAELTKEKNNFGLCSTSDVILADKALTEAQSKLNDLEKYQSLFLNQLAVLTGQSVDNSLFLKRTSFDEIKGLQNLPLNLSSDVILKRPDILKAEAELQKAKIDVSLARKDFLPDISLSGQFGFNSNTFSKVLNWDSYVASIGVGVAETIFSGGQRRARLKAKKFHYEQLFENYQKTILTSFQEVNDSLVALKTDGQKDKDNLNRLRLEKENLDLIDAKYKEGLISYLDTLEYKEKYAMLEQEQIQSKVDNIIDSLSLYKAAGGKITETVSAN